MTTASGQICAEAAKWIFVSVGWMARGRLRSVYTSGDHSNQKSWDWTVFALRGLLSLIINERKRMSSWGLISHRRLSTSEHLHVVSFNILSKYIRIWVDSLVLDTRMFRRWRKSYISRRNMWDCYPLWLMRNTQNFFF